MDTERLIALPPDERLALIAALWDSLGDAAPLPAAQADELGRRLQAFEQERPSAVAWDVLKAELARRDG